MPVHLLAAASWLLVHAGGLLFNTVSRNLMEGMGLVPRPLTGGDVEVLLDRYLHQFEDRITRRLIDRMDEDRLATLNSAMKLVKAASAMAGMTDLKKGYLINASSKFFDTTSLPQQGRTGGFANAELICLAYLGIAAIHLEMQEPYVDIAQNIVSAIYTHPDTARQWFGEAFIKKLLTVCPQCGTENAPGARYCKNDNYPLPVSPVDSFAQSTFVSMRTLIMPRYCSNGHPNPQEVSVCESCAELIIASYCSLGHVNPLGTSLCSDCGEPLASLF